MGLRSLVESNRSHLAHMIVVNNKYDLIKEKWEEFSVKTTHSRSHLNSVKILSNILENCRSTYSQNVIDSITIALAKCIDSVLLDKEYGIELEMYSRGEHHHLRPWLIDEDGVKLPPNIVEGDMLNQVLSFCASVILTKLQGYDIFFYDEAFASANPRSVLMIRGIIKMFIEEGMTFVFVGQNPLLFSGFDRNLIELVQEEGCVSTVIQRFIPASESSILDEQAIELHDRILRG